MEVTTRQWNFASAIRAPSGLKDGLTRRRRKRIECMKARDGVANKWGQTHDVKNLFVSDGSQFTSGRGVQPTLTIVALAIRQADTIAGMMSRREV